MRILGSRPVSFAMACCVSGLVIYGIVRARDGKVPSGTATAVAQSGRSTASETAAQQSKNPLIRALSALLDEADDVAPGDRKVARATLREADTILSNVKRENADALRQANRQLRVKDCDAPNIVLIVLDDVGYGDLGCYGQQMVRTPHIDRMASQGIRCTQFYAGSSLGVPSRGSMLTGRHTGHGQLQGGEWVTVRRDDPTLAEVLWQGGYATGLVGKWGVGDIQHTGTPNDQGFDHAFGFLDRKRAENYYPEFLWRNGSRVVLQGNLKGQKQQYATDLITKEALAFLHHRWRRPFFLGVCYTTVHANNDLAQKTGNGMEVPDDAPYTDQDWPAPQKNFAAALTHVDRQVGEILDFLDDSGLSRNTIVFLTSDNGPHKEGGVDPEFFDGNGSLRGIKGALYEGGIRVPMIVRLDGWQRAAQRGVTCEQVWACWDLLPTLADLTGAWWRPGGLDGISMAPALGGRGQRDHEFLYWERHQGGFAQAVRAGDWKAVRQGQRGPWQLYDLKSDPEETDDVASGNPDVVGRLGQLAAAAKAP